MFDDAESALLEAILLVTDTLLTARDLAEDEDANEAASLDRRTKGGTVGNNVVDDEQGVPLVAKAVGIVGSGGTMSLSSRDRSEGASEALLLRRFGTVGKGATRCDGNISLYTRGDRAPTLTDRAPDFAGRGGAEALTK